MTIKNTPFTMMKNPIATTAMGEYQEQLDALKTATGDNHDQLMAENRRLNAHSRMDQKFRSEINGVEVGSVPARAISKQHTCFQNNQAAYDAGQWIRAKFLGNESARLHCLDRGLIKSAMGGNDDLRGGVLVPEPLENTIIALREMYGVFRSNCQVIAMGGDSMLVPRMASDLTSYYVSENSEITKSDMTLNQCTLTSKKLATLTVVSSELNEDSIISIAEILAESVAQSFAVQEDTAGFLGDSTPAYGNIAGLDTALLAGSVYTATSRQTFSALTLNDFENTVGKAKLWGGSRPSWFISNAGYCASMLRLQNVAGGNNRQDLGAGVEPTFMGYPVVVSQVLPSALTGTTGTTAMFFGDLRKSVLFGSRRGVTLSTDPSRYFELDAIGVRATERYDIVVHDVGTASTSGGLIKVVFG
jgi:HK97 family phage major capsid protein